MLHWRNGAASEQARSRCRTSSASYSSGSGEDDRTASRRAAHPIGRRLLRKLQESTYQTPPVSCFAVTDSLDDLWRKILGCSTVGVGSCSLLVGLKALFRKSKVRDLDVALVVEQDILWLEVAVDNSVLVEHAQGFDQLCCVKAGSPLTELLVLPQVIEQLSAIQEVHHKVQLCGSLERIVQFHNEGTVDLLKNVTLSCHHILELETRYHARNGGMDYLP